MPPSKASFLRVILSKGLDCSSHRGATGGSSEALERCRKCPNFHVTYTPETTTKLCIHRHTPPLAAIFGPNLEALLRTCLPRANRGVRGGANDFPMIWTVRETARCISHTVSEMRSSHDQSRVFPHWRHRDLSGPDGKTPSSCSVT